MNKVFYVPGTAHAIDYARETQDGRFISYWQGRTLEEIAEDYPGAILCDEAEFLRQQSAMLKQSPQAITEREYYEALEVLPPLNWQGGGGFESFMSCEFYSGNVTYIYLRNRASGQHWKMRDDAGLSHDDIVRSVSVQPCGQA
ncbi:hypothetical protein [Paraburkholderia flagellata]|uniref:hypothetical protein n=1 Tax=Paraburkholderia flagellata TaxID=2883241 RepID=UPI001F3CAFB3|nr:hypothetical protein [Paraburkholderia flagellata]